MTDETNNEFSASDMATAAADGFRAGQKVALAGATNNASEPVAWMTHHDEPMLFLAEKEAAAYCYDDERPIPLCTAPPAAAVVPECLQNFLDHKFTQLAVFDDGRTPLYLTEEQYNSIRSHVRATVVPEGWRPVPVASLERMWRFIDPAPMRMPNGDTMTFQNPHAAAALREISAEFRAMLAAPTPEPASLWISVAERMPKPNTVVLASSKRSPHFFAIHKNRAMDPWEYMDGDTCREKVTHWMPLPSAPANQAEVKP